MVEQQSPLQAGDARRAPWQTASVVSSSESSSMPHDLSVVQRRLLLEHHRRLLEEESGIAPDVIAERGYWSATTTSELAGLGFSPAQQRVPALVLPKYSTAGVNGAHEIRPDRPRVQNRAGRERALKYESVVNSRVMVDVHPRTVAILDDHPCCC